MTTAKFTADEANPSWFPRVLRVLARDYPKINDRVWSTAIDENAAEQVAAREQREMINDRSLRCPSCGSPQPSMHPAVSGGGEVTRVCPDPWHSGAALGDGTARTL